MFDLGYFKVPFLVGSVVLIVATFLTAHCHEYWHFLLCQGVTIGVCSVYLCSKFILTIFSWLVEYVSDQLSAWSVTGSKKDGESP